MRLAWLTDIHLNFVDTELRQRFLQSLCAQCDAVAISGDIAESNDVEGYLRELDRILQRPVFFVLGNHDFYRGSILGTRKAVTGVARNSDHLVYLTATGVVGLTPNTALIGHDGWADGQCGDFAHSDVMLNDYCLIEELRMWDPVMGLDKGSLREALLALGAEAARHLQRNLALAAADYSNVIAVTHGPPFREAAWYEGRTSDDDYLPHFACKAVGDALVQVMQSHPRCRLLVLCGHTHGWGEVDVLDNLRVVTGEAYYGAPSVQQVLEIE